MEQYEHGGAWVVAAHGAYDMHSIGPLTAVLETAAATASGVSFADSTFLNLLISTHRLTDLRVAAPNPQLQRGLEMTGADTVLTVQATVEDAAP
ncbi:STAS domain-containing protein [Streptomyces sp. NPDC101209]|uniref:STAS domain-containing protein n=1 Tax=Streptomyces sp. NPDC101209 TaxID=3366129 RepID=UPI0037F3A3ED